VLNRINSYFHLNAKIQDVEMREISAIIANALAFEAGEPIQKGNQDGLLRATESGNSAICGSDDNSGSAVNRGMGTGQVPPASSGADVAVAVGARISAQQWRIAHGIEYGSWFDDDAEAFREASERQQHRYALYVKANERAEKVEAQLRGLQGRLEKKP
jgi:hypothetical protein